MKKIFLILVLIFTFSLVACASDDPQPTREPAVLYEFSITLSNGNAINILASGCQVTDTHTFLESVEIKCWGSDGYFDTVFEGVVLGYEKEE